MRKGERAEGTRWGKAISRPRPSVLRRPPPPFKGAEETEEEGWAEGVLVAVEVERQEIRIEMRQRNEMSTLSERQK